mgnify:CR=1 FL=1
MIEFEDVRIAYKDKPVLDGVSLTIHDREFFVLIGSSGCGKTTLLKSINKLLPLRGGSLSIDGIPVEQIKVQDLPKKVGYVVQSGGLFPHLTVEENIALTMQIARFSKEAIRDRVDKMLKMVNLDPEIYRGQYPSQLSGGQQQRVGIARALSLQPQFIVCDEPVSSLDVSIQAQVLNLLKDLQAEFHLTYLFITHDLSVVKFFSDKIAVMYLGQLVETADSAELFRQPLHPYSQALLSAIPIPSSRQKMQRVKLIGELQSPIDPEPGCRFAKRCLYAREGCTGRDLALRDFGSGHFCACCRAGALEEQTPSK